MGGGGLPGRRGRVRPGAGERVAWRVPTGRQRKVWGPMLLEMGQNYAFLFLSILEHIL
jgi:hypothetical protein